MVRKKNGIEVIMKLEFVGNVSEVERASDSVISLKLEIQKVMLNVSGYALQPGNKRFFGELDEMIENIPRGESDQSRLLWACW